MKGNAKTIFFISLLLFLTVSIPALSETVQYSYDHLNRLTRVESDSGAVIEYTYDATGNRLTKEVSIIDTDIDGISDTIENNSCTDTNDADTDDDGIIDGVEDANHNGVLDPGETDPCDNDTDGDGVQDGTESGFTLADVGPDTNLSVFQPDLNPGTTTDPLNPDSDGDGINDGVEDANHDGKVDAGETDPNEDISIEPTPPEIKEVIPHNNAGFFDDTRVLNDASFAVRIEDSDGIDITDQSSIVFTINDGANTVYERDLSNNTLEAIPK